MKREYFFIGIGALIVVSLIPSSVFGQEHSEIQVKVKELQEENKELRQELRQQKDLVNQLVIQMKDIEKKTETLIQQPGVSQNVKGLPHSVLFQEPGEIVYPQLDVKGFGDISYKMNWNGEDNNEFSLGQLDFFANSKITEKLNFLFEGIFEFDPQTNATEVDLERMLIKYSFSDYFNLKAGRMHVPLGYWNQTYHHGTWLQTTIERPVIYRFEDDGGALPIHAVGVSASGNFDRSLFNLSYDAGVFNGRGRTSVREIQHVTDFNNSKAFNFLLSAEPHFIEGLKMGANAYYDRIPSNPSVGLRTDFIRELILGGFATYQIGKLTVLGELFHIGHADHALNRTFNTVGSYAQASYAIGKWTPYYRFDFMNFGNNDTYFTDNSAVDARIHTAGLRWDLYDWSALKFEFSHSDNKNQEDEDLLAANTSFAF